MLPPARFVKLAFLAGSCALAIGLGLACIPLPHRARMTPLILGQISQNGTAMDNASVRLSRAKVETGDPCGNPFVETTTNAAGRFRLDPLEKWYLFMPLGPADCAYRWRVCLRYEGRWRTLSESDDFNGCLVGPPGIEYLKCEWNSAQNSSSQESCDSQRDLDD